MSHRKFWAITISASFHVVLVIVLWSLYAPRPDQSTKNNSPIKTKPSLDDPKATQMSPAQPVDIPSEQIQASVESQIEQIEKVSEEQKLSELDRNLERLNRIVDEESIPELTSAVAQAMGIDSTQYANQSIKPDGPLDTTTAQIEDVKRNKRDDGSWSYTAIMVDADGRRSEVPMSKVEGESVYQTFEKMNQFPMAKGIYRELVMPMLQKMMERPKDRYTC